MRTSNKILIAVLVFVFATISLIFGMLGSKYNRGAYVSRDAYETNRSELVKTSAFTSIELINCSGVSLERSDSFAMRVNKNVRSNFTHRIEGEKLIIEGNSDENGGMIFASIHIKCPNLKTLILKNSWLYLADYETSVLSTEISGESTLMTGGAKIDSLEVRASDHSRLELTGETGIKSLTVSLNGRSGMRTESSQIGILRIMHVSDSATLELDGRSFKAFTDTIERK